MTHQEKIQEILKKYFFDKHNIPIEYGACNEIMYQEIKTIDELSQSSGKGFCVRTANRIKNKMSETGQEVSRE